MTARPTKYPEWGSDGTNVIEPPAQLKATGWLSGGLAIPQFENWIGLITYQWIQYLDARGTAAAWRWQIPLGRSAAEVNITWDDSTGTATASPGPGLLDSIPVRVDVGETISTIGARILGTGGGGSVVVHLYRLPADGSGRVAIGAINVPAPAATWTKYTSDLGTPEVVADGVGYVLEVEMPTTGQAIALVGVEVAGGE